MSDIEYVDENGCSWDSYKNYVYSKFGYWSYDGDTEEKVFQLLKELYFGNMPDSPGQYFIRNSEGYEWAFQALLLEVLSSNDFTEYGTSPRGAWLTRKGRELLRPLMEGK